MNDFTHKNDKNKEDKDVFKTHIQVNDIYYTPKLKETTIHLEFPNETNKVEVERQQYDLLGFIRKALNNFDINLSITINDVMEKQYAYTPFEKFEKLKEKNKNIDILRKTFDLDI